jgi:menaquinone-dependent protoporphyrinogen oxidase
MKTVILYASSHGTVRWCAEEIRSLMQGEVRLVDLRREKAPELSEFSRVIIGASVHAGRLAGSVAKYIRRHEQELCGMTLGLFLCSMERSREQFDSLYPEPLRSRAAAQGIFGGRMEPEELNPLLRFVVRKVQGSLEAQDTIDRSAIEGFVSQMELA